MAGQRSRFHPDAPVELEKYLLPTEKIIFVLQRHWIVVLEPVLTAVAGLVVLVAVLSRFGAGKVQIAVLVIAVLLLLRLLFYIVERHHELFLATDRRLMLVHGLLTRKVDIMPMSKVTDMRYDRTLTGRLFGYGVYILESAGQDQALSTINFIPDPDRHYQEISQVIFAPSKRRLSDKLTASSTGSLVPIAEPEHSWWRRS